MTSEPRKWTVFRNVPFLLRHRNDPLHVVQHIQRTGGDYVRGRLQARESVYLISHPDAIRYVLYTNQQNYIRGEPKWSPLLRAVGNGLLFADGERHRRQRRFVQPAFQPQRIAEYSKIIHDAAQRLRREWHMRSGETVDMNQEMMRYTMIAIGQVLFDLDLSGQACRLGQIITEVLGAVAELSVSPWARFTWFPARANRRLKRFVREFDDLTYELIRQRRASGVERRDLLSQLLRAQDEGSSFEDPRRRLSDVEVRDQVAILFGAGHETSANMLTWMWFLLARHPQVEARLHAELDDVLGDRHPTFEDLKHLEYTRMILNESLRLYPPAWINKRRCVQADTIEGHAVEAGASIFMCPYLVHRDPRWFPDPESFVPERFAAERMAQLPKFCYFPFGGGFRQCIGQSFAEMEGLMTIAALAREFAPRCAHEGSVVPDAVFLRPRDGLPMRLVPRTDRRRVAVDARPRLGVPH